MKLNLGCSNISNSVDFLKNKFNVVNPYIYKNKNIIKNFNIYFAFDDMNTDTIETCKLLSIPYFGCNRKTKRDQIQVLENLSINTPNTYSIFKQESESLPEIMYLLLEELEDDDKIIIKSNWGAKGIGQVLLTKNELYDFYSKLANDEPLDKFNLGGGKLKKEEVEFLKTEINSKSFIIQDKLSIVEEYRYIWFYKEDPIIIKRTISDTGWQNNISLTGIGKYIEPTKTLNDFKPTIDKLCNYLNVPYLAVDIYVDNKDTIGILEFQQGMGFNSVPKSEFVNKVISSVDTKIKDIT